VETQKRGKAKTREGVVLSDKMDKTVVVLVERLVQHAKYKKHLRRRNKVKAHDEQNRCSIGDRVIIAETRPLSRDKRWTVRQILEKAV
jgi:small subunit ribosomal protein S17